MAEFANLEPLNSDDQLADVEILDSDDQELLFADLSLFNSGSRFYFYSILFIVGIHLIGIPVLMKCFPLINTVINTSPINNPETDPFSIGLSFNLNYRPFTNTHFLQLFLKLQDITAPLDNKFSGAFSLTTVGAEVNHVYEKSFDSTYFTISEKDTFPVPLFYTTSVDFNTVNLSVVFNQVPPAASISTIWRYYNLGTFYLINSLRICFAIAIFVVYFISFFKKVSNEGFNSLNLLQNFTLILMTFSVLFFIPFSLFSSSPKVLLLESIFKNMFFAFSLFYSLSVFVYIVEKPMESPINYLLVPYFIFIMFSIFWIVKDSKYVFPESDFIFPTISADNLPPFYYTCFVVLYIIVYIIWTLVLSRQMKDSQKNRFGYYTRVNAFAFFSYLLYIVLCYIDNTYPAYASAASNAFPYVSVVLYLVAMALGQQDTEPYKEYKLHQQENVELLENQIMADV